MLQFYRNDTVFISILFATVRTRQIPLAVEGKLIRGFEGLDAGDGVRVELISADVKRGFIDFSRAGRGQGS
jgi:hypothetical protein